MIIGRMIIGAICALAMAGEGLARSVAVKPDTRALPQAETMASDTQEAPCMRRESIVIRTYFVIVDENGQTLDIGALDVRLRC